MDVLPLGLVGDGALRAAAAARREAVRMEGVQMDHLVEYLHWARESWVEPREQVRGGERLIQLGGPGTVMVPEFAICEIAAALGISQPAASGLCADMLDLAQRLPQVAGGVRSGLLGFDRARLIARRSRELTVEQAGLVEASVMAGRDTARGRIPLAALVPWGRVRELVDQAVLRARGPETVAEAEARVAQTLFVDLYRTEDGATDLAARLAAADAARLDQRLDQVAGWLVRVGDGRPKAVLRAVALGLLADPAMLKALDSLRKERPAVDPPDPERPRARVGRQRDFVPPPRPPADLDMLPGPGTDGESPLPAATEPDSFDPPESLRAGDPSPGAPVLTLLPESPLAPGSEPDLDIEPDPDAEPDPGAEPDPDAEPDQASRHADASISVRPAGIAGLPPQVLERLAGLSSTVLYVHLDQTSGTCTLEGAGALSRAQATAIVGHSRVMVRPVLDLESDLTYTGYAVPPLLREQLALLNAGYCCFPGCGRRARLSEADHRDPHAKGRRGWAEPERATGRTTSANMQPLCKKHHRAKTHARWRVINPARGVWVWTSPSGASYLVTGGVTTPLNTTARLEVAERNRRRVGAVVAGSESCGPAVGTPSSAWVTVPGDAGYDYPADLTPAEADVTYGYLDTE